MRAETRYAKSGQVHIAYQVFGHGAVDLVCVPGFVSHLEHDLREPHIASYFDRLATFARVIVFDKRGTGLSDRELENPTLEGRMDDIRAVMDVVGSAEAAIYGVSEGGSLASLFAATYPERSRALILYGAFEKFSSWIKTEAQLQGIFGYFDHAWGSGELCGRVAPSLVSNAALRDWFRAHERLGASPSAAMTLMRMNSEIDIRHVLPAICVPTLVLHQRICWKRRELALICTTWQRRIRPVRLRTLLFTRTAGSRLSRGRRLIGMAVKVWAMSAPFRRNFC